MKNEINEKRKYTRYKIEHKRNFKNKTGTITYLNLYKDKIRLYKFQYDMINKNKSYNSDFNTISFKNNKFNIYKINIATKKIQNISNKFIICPSKTKISEKRIIKYCNKLLLFLNQNKIKTQSYNTLMKSICYPIIKEFIKINPNILIDYLEPSLSSDLRKISTLPELSKKFFKIYSFDTIFILNEAIKQNKIIELLYRLSCIRAFLSPTELIEISKYYLSMNIKGCHYPKIKKIRAFLRYFSKEDIIKISKSQEFNNELYNLIYVAYFHKNTDPRILEDYTNFIDIRSLMILIGKNINQYNIKK